MFKLCLNDWYCITRRDCDTCDVILNQNICGNFHIRNKGLSIFYPNWTKSNLVQIRDIWDVNTQGWKSGEFIYNHLIDKRNWMAEYTRIKAMVPQKWKDILCNIPVENRQVQLQNSQNIFFSSESIQIDGKEKHYSKIKQKDILFACLYPT